MSRENGYNWIKYAGWITRSNYDERDHNLIELYECQTCFALVRDHERHRSAVYGQPEKQPGFASC